MRICQRGQIRPERLTGLVPGGAPVGPAPDHSMQVRRFEMSKDYVTVLRREFGAEEGSFLLKLRCEMEWDKKAFSPLIS